MSSLSLSKKSSESWAFSVSCDIMIPGDEGYWSEKIERRFFEIVDTESLVPAEHLLSKIDAAMDFNKIYDMVEHLYCVDNGRPSVDPVVLFKMDITRHLYGMDSLRCTVEEVSLNIAYPCFLGCRTQEDTPHFSTVRYNFRYRFASKTVNQIFIWILSGDGGSRLCSSQSGVCR